MSFELVVVEAFKLSDGRTLLGCEVAAAPRFIGPCKCTLQMDGKPISVIQLEGENLPDPNRSGLRVVSTQSSVPIDRSKVKEKVYRLVCDDVHEQQ